MEAGEGDAYHRYELPPSPPCSHSSRSLARSLMKRRVRRVPCPVLTRVDGPSPQLFPATRPCVHTQLSSPPPYPGSLCLSQGCLPLASCILRLTPSLLCKIIPTLPQEAHFHKPRCTNQKEGSKFGNIAKRAEETSVRSGSRYIIPLSLSGTRAYLEGRTDALAPMASPRLSLYLRTQRRC